METIKRYIPGFVIAFVVGSLLTFIIAFDPECSEYNYNRIKDYVAGCPSLSKKVKELAANDGIITGSEYDEIYKLHKRCRIKGILEPITGGM